MKQVIFLCLLSLTLCLAKPSEPAPASHEPAVDQKAVVSTPSQTPIVPAPTQSTPKQNGTEEKPAANNSNVQPATHAETQKTNATASDSNKTIEKDEKATTLPPHVVEPSTNAPNNKSTEVKPAANSTKTPEEKKGTTVKNDTTTSVPETPKQPDVPKSTVAPKSDEVQHIVQARSFDGPSFIGGIILTLGLLAIGFMGFKYYKNQTERNYHTL